MKGITQVKRIFISTGEVSGDLQGALLITALKKEAIKRNIEIEISALGGDRMEKAGAKIIANTLTIGSMGILESVPYILPTIKVQNQAKKYLKENHTDLAILVDYMGPNLGMGSYLKKHLSHIPVVYYIAPQVWVWSLDGKDTKTIINISDKILSIFPEEYNYFHKNGANVSWVGHPLVDRMKNAPSKEMAREKLGIKSTEIAIALLSASRKQEIKYLLPNIFTAAKQIQSKLENVHFWLPLSLENYREDLEKAIKKYDLKATIIKNSLEVLPAMDLAITKSGTVNLELALLNVPQVVVYRVNPVTAWIAENILKFSIQYMSPVNLVLMRPVVPEFLQYYATVENIVNNGLELLLNEEKRAKTLADYEEMRGKLGSEGVCDRAAKEIIDFLL
ncbi:MAG TPA: lipid-A-disaccharide synthase [Allocoleopsis sp.]